VVFIATYVISDIHGQYDMFMELIDKIDLKQTDTLYVLGDILDRGPHPIKVLKKLMEMPNAICIVGNHENFEHLNSYPTDEWNGGKVHFVESDIIHFYILSHSGPREVVAAMGYGEMSDDEVEFRQYLQRVADNTEFTAWYFGHFHEDTEVEDMFFCLYDEVVAI